MNNKQLVFSMALIVTLLLTACGPSAADIQSTAAAIQTGAAQTVAAQFTLNALLTPSATNTLEPTNTPTLTETPSGSLTATPTKVTSGGASGGTQGGVAGGGCDVMGFVADVTIPDGTSVTAGSTFTKTWRLKNNGSCTWSTSYSVVYNNGDRMNGPTTQALTASVTPGNELDVTMSLTAPSTAGSYTGAWNLRNAAGENFGYFYVQISVGSGSGSGSGTATSGGACNGTPVGNTTCVVLTASAPGSPISGGGSLAGIVAGDNDANAGIRGLFNFNLGNIPANATISSVTLNLSSRNATTDPFSNGFGVLNVLSVGAGAGYGTSGTSIATFDSYGALDTSIANDALKTAVQAAVNSNLYFKIQFSQETNSNSADNRLNLFGPTLTVTYTTP